MRVQSNIQLNSFISINLQRAYKLQHKRNQMSLKCFYIIEERKCTKCTKNGTCFSSFNSNCKALFNWFNSTSNWFHAVAPNSSEWSQKLSNKFRAFQFGAPNTPVREIFWYIQKKSKSFFRCSFCFCFCFCFRFWRILFIVFITSRRRISSWLTRASPFDIFGKYHHIANEQNAYDSLSLKCDSPIKFDCLMKKKLTVNKYK